MELFQILDCSTLGTCCSDYSLVAFLVITKKIFEVLQFVVPIALLIAGTIQFVQLTINPELKDGFRRILNKLMAAFFVFFIPFMVDTVLGVVSDDFSFTACWEQAKIVSVEGLFNNGSYIDEVSEKKVLMEPQEYEKVEEEKAAKEEEEKTKSNTKTPTNNSSGVSAKQKAIVAYAKSFLNKGYKYKYKGSWDCTGSYKPTDCSGFVKCVYKNAAGASIPRKANNMWLKRDQYFEVVKEKNLEPGDIIYYGGSGHVGIYTGKGKEIIHNKGTGYGIVKDSNYNKASRHGKPKGFLRLKGVKQ